MLLNPYLETQHLSLCNGKRILLDFVHSFYSIIKYLSKKMKWLLINQQKNTDIKAMLGLDFILSNLLLLSLSTVAIHKILLA